MVPELEKPRITEIHVRMDCNGCVQKIKRALHGINGIYDLYIDFPNQKLTIVGWADPEKIVKAIKKTRKTAIICSHTEPPDSAAEQPPDGGAPAPDASNPPPQDEPPAEPPKDAAPPENMPPAPEQHPNSQPEPDRREGQPPHDGQPMPAPPAGQMPPGPKDAGEVHVVYHHPPPPDYGYRYGYGRNFGGDRWYNSYPGPRGHEFQQELPSTPLQPSMPVHAPPMSIPMHPPPTSMPSHPPPTPMQQSMPSQPPPPQPQPIYLTHSYNTYKPSPYVTEYHDYTRPPPPQAPQPPQPQYRYYGPTINDQFNDQEYYYNYPHYYQGGNGNGSGSSNGNIASFFSDENPNACRIM